jgi:PAS domain S-box-containing protein
VFRIFAGRAAAELGRLRRDRELAERERKLSRIIDSAMDAIIELDERLSVNNVNPAARKIFALDEAAEVSGESFKAFLTRDSFDQLVYFVGELDRKRDGLQSLWLSGGVNARTRDGAVFPAEATLSRFEIDGRPFYTLILRDMNELQKAEERIRYLQSQVDALRGSDEILGESDVLGRVLDDVDRVAEQDTTVLITGETGTGKELIVGAIHRRSSRADKSLIRVNCAAIAANLQESEFFGHEKGAFTGATQRREGRFKLADGGTIFLDEVGEMPLDLQAKLLRVLQEGEFDPVGSTRTETIDVRVIAATNQDLVAMVEEGSFRRDLLYRLNVFPLHLPPLRDRGDDVSILAEAFLRKLIERGGRSRIRLTENCKARLRRYDWPGNVRELENVIERAFITTTDGRLLNLDRALPKTHGTGPDATAAPEADPERILTATELRDLERSNLIRGLEAAGWKISGPDGAAERIGLKPNTLASRMKALGIRRPR